MRLYFRARIIDDVVNKRFILEGKKHWWDIEWKRLEQFSYQFQSSKAAQRSNAITQLNSVLSCVIIDTKEPIEEQKENEK